MTHVLQNHFMLIWWLIGAGGLCLGFIMDFEKGGRGSQVLRDAASLASPTVALFLFFAVISLFGFFGPLIYVRPLMRRVTAVLDSLSGR